GGWEGRQRRYWVVYGIAVTLTVAECFFAQAAAFVFCVYLAVLTVAARVRWAPIAILFITLAPTVAPAVIPRSGGGADWQGGLTVLLVSFAMFGFFHIIAANRDLAAARAEVARLAAENE